MYFLGPYLPLELPCQIPFLHLVALVVQEVLFLPLYPSFLLLLGVLSVQEYQEVQEDQHCRPCQADLVVLVLQVFRCYHCYLRVLYPQEVQLDPAILEDLVNLDVLWYLWDRFFHRFLAFLVSLEGLVFQSFLVALRRQEDLHPHALL